MACKKVFNEFLTALNSTVSGEAVVAYRRNDRHHIQSLVAYADDLCRRSGDGFESTPQDNVVQISEAVECFLAQNNDSPDLRFLIVCLVDLLIRHRTPDGRSYVFREAVSLLMPNVYGSVYFKLSRRDQHHLDKVLNEWKQMLPYCVVEKLLAEFERNKLKYDRKLKTNSLGLTHRSSDSRRQKENAKRHRRIRPVVADSKTTSNAAAFQTEDIATTSVDNRDRDVNDPTVPLPCFELPLDCDVNPDSLIDDALAIKAAAEAEYATLSEDKTSKRPGDVGVGVSENSLHTVFGAEDVDLRPKQLKKKRLTRSARRHKAMEKHARRAAASDKSREAEVSVHLDAVGDSFLSDNTSSTRAVLERKWEQVNAAAERFAARQAAKGQCLKPKSPQYDPSDPCSEETFIDDIEHSLSRYGQPIVAPTWTELEQIAAVQLPSINNYEDFDHVTGDSVGACSETIPCKWTRAVPLLPLPVRQPFSFKINPTAENLDGPAFLASKQIKQEKQPLQLDDAIAHAVAITMEPAHVLKIEEAIAHAVAITMEQPQVLKVETEDLESTSHDRHSVVSDCFQSTSSSISAPTTPSPALPCILPHGSFDTLSSFVSYNGVPCRVLYPPTLPLHCAAIRCEETGQLHQIRFIGKEPLLLIIRVPKYDEVHRIILSCEADFSTELCIPHIARTLTVRVGTPGRELIFNDEFHVSCSFDGDSVPIQLPRTLNPFTVQLIGLQPKVFIEPTEMTQPLSTSLLSGPMLDSPSPVDRIPSLVAFPDVCTHDTYDSDPCTASASGANQPAAAGVGIMVPQRRIPDQIG